MISNAITPDALYEELVQLGRQWAELNAAAHILEQSKNSVRAQYAVEHMAKGGPVAKAELAADADPRYMQHLRALSEARKRANIARVNYDALHTKVDLYRSQQATERAVMSKV